MSSALERGSAALAAGAWDDARAAFEEALAGAESAVARSGLGLALWWLGRVRDGLEQRELAYAALADAGDARAAATLAIWIGTEHAGAYGNRAVANGWCARAERLLADAGPCAERVQLALWRAQRAASPEEALAQYKDALAMAHALGARDLELLAQSNIGRVLVSLGRVADGFARLDEAMTATVAGELREHQFVAFVSCNMLLACEQVHDVPRATEWLRVSRDWAKTRHCLPFFAVCRVVYGGILMAQGRWSEAEDELVDSLQRFEATHPAASARAAVKLAELRIAQGELDVAEALLEPWRDHSLAACAVSHLHLARGATELAVARLERVDFSACDPAACAPVCDAMVQAFLARGELDAARRAAARMRAVADARSTPVLSAIADATAGAVEAAAGEPDAAKTLQRALDAFTEMAMPYEAARVRLALAGALSSSRREAAAVEARAAMAAFEQLGALPSAELAARKLEEISGGSRPPTARRRAGPDALTRREAEVLQLLREGLSNPAIAERLDISAKTAEHHVRAILAKLDLKTRAAAAAWAARQEKALP
jgi:DNA-binding NarL/FixJ family response regulator